MMSLNSSPGIYISSEENLPEKLERLGKLIGTRERHLAKAHDGLIKTEATQGGRMRATSERENWVMDDVLPFHFSSRHTPALLKNLYRLQNDERSPDTPLAIFGDKMPAYCRTLDFDNLPFGAKYIHITRNPYDVINSMLRRVQMTRQGLDWWKAITELDDMMAWWNDAFAVIRAEEHRPGVLHIQYEDLVFATEEVREAIREFLGLPVLDFGFPLVDDAARHFDRAYLDDGITERIRETCKVADYAEYLSARHQGQASLASLTA